MVILNLISGALLSFLSLGIIWTGVNQWIQAIVTVTFFILSYFTFKPSKTPMYSILIGAGPLGSLLTQFRDKNDSHLLGITIAGSWVLATLLGGWLASKKTSEK
jgi:hypothetical protein